MKRMPVIALMLLCAVARPGGSEISGAAQITRIAEVGAWHLAVDAARNVFVSDSGTIRRIDAVTGAITTIAGNGGCGAAGDDGPARDATLCFVMGIALAPNGD